MADAAPKRLNLLGATGSIGGSTLRLMQANPGRFQLAAVTANRNVQALAELAIAQRAKIAVIADTSLLDELQRLLEGSGIRADAGEQALCEAAAFEADMTVAAMVGAAGIGPVLAAIRAGLPVALANKEALVCAGGLVMAEARQRSVAILPVDSEHNAVFQVFDNAQRAAIRRIVLTASGGPFRAFTREQMQAVTPAQAVAHPNWDMGAKISVDSATMMNKGLEQIEAMHLFGLAPEKVDVLVHPQSVVHGLVEYEDGSMLAQLGAPDMCTPLAVALAWPERIHAPCERLDLAAIGRLDFEPPDMQRFPALRLAQQAMHESGTAPAILNAANEVAVAAFLAGEIGFLQIAEAVEAALQAVEPAPLDGLETALRADASAREFTRGYCSRRY